MNQVLKFLEGLGQSSHEAWVLNVMREYRDSRIADEFNKKAKAEKEIEEKGKTKVEPWNPQIVNTVFLWVVEALGVDCKDSPDAVYQSLQTLVRTERVLQHPQYTRCYYLPLSK